MKEKPYRTPVSNCLWMAKGYLKHAPAVIWMYMACVPFNVFLQYAQIYIPSLAVKLVTEGASISRATGALLIISAAVFVAGAWVAFSKEMIASSVNDYRIFLQREMNARSLTLFYGQYERKETRELAARADAATYMWNGVRPITDMPRQMFHLIEGALSYLLFGTVVSFVNPYLAVLLTLSPLVNWFCVRAYNNWMHRNREKWTEVDSRFFYLVEKPQDALLSKDIRIYGMAGWLKSVFQDVKAERKQIDNARRMRQFLSHSVDLLVILLRDGIAYAYLIKKVMDGAIPVDKFVLYFAAVASVADTVGMLLRGINDLHASSLAICDLRKYLEMEQVPDGMLTVEGLETPPEIRFEDVSFQYEGAEAPVIGHLSFTLHRGEKLAIVGLNGAGKTTLVKLLCGLYRPIEGRITIDGVNAADFQRNEYYKLFSPVFQDSRYAFFTLAETVSGKTEDQTDFERAERCLRQAGLGAKIDSLPNGIHTHLDKQLYKDGTELSGGETQKLMLARALYKNAPVLILDEPTAAMDPISENEVYLRYNEFSGGKSSVFISHRLASTRFCDRILYLENGAIAEEGTHDALMKQGGKYKTLFDMQARWYKDGEEADK